MRVKLVTGFGSILQSYHLLLRRRAHVIVHGWSSRQYMVSAWPFDVMLLGINTVVMVLLACLYFSRFLTIVFKRVFALATTRVVMFQNGAAGDGAAAASGGWGGGQAADGSGAADFSSGGATSSGPPPLPPSSGLRTTTIVT